MNSLFLNSGIQHLTYVLPEEEKGNIERIPIQDRIGLLGSWNQEPVDGAPWLKWRITRRERIEDASEYYELMLAIDTTSGPVKHGFIAESERHLPDEPFSFCLEIIEPKIRLTPASQGHRGFQFSIEMISSRFGGETINVALVLDVGNSRTMGLLVDETADTLSLQDNVFPFVLRGRDDPAREESVFSTDLELAASPLAPAKYPSGPLGIHHEQPESPERPRAAGLQGLQGLLQRFKRSRNHLDPLNSMETQARNEQKHPQPFTRDLSFIRMGREADLLQSTADDISGNAMSRGLVTGMSSPKRYLWDNEPVDSAWFMHGPALSGSSPRELKQLAGQKLLSYFTDEDTDWPSGNQLSHILDDTASGVPDHSIARRNHIDEQTLRYWREVFKDQKQLAEDAAEAILPPPMWPVMGQPPLSPAWAKYPRRSAMVWLLLDLFVRAWEQINSPQFRGRARFPNRRRRLRDIVITFPACIPPEEKERYRLQGMKALGILINEILPEEEGNPPPRLHWDWDEARSVHMVFLYAATRAAGLDGEQFFRMFSRPSQSGDQQIRLASLDIGGGTADLAVIDYAHSADVGVALKPHLIFQDGLRVGGDDVLLAIIEEYVLPVMAKHVGLTGQQLGAVINGVAAGSGAGPWTSSVQEAAYWRRRWMRSIWVPLATEILSRMAITDEKSTSGAGFACRNVCRDFRALEKISRAASQAGVPLSHTPEECLYPLDLEILNGIVTEALDLDVRSLCGACVQNYPDFVIISGRITGVPVVRDLILRYLPIPPHRVVFLHGFPVGGWYPLVYQDSNGQIKDAKSSVAVGATIGLLAAKNKLPFFKVMPMTQEPDPGYYWGSGTHLSTILAASDLGFDPSSKDNTTWARSVAGGKLLLLRKRDGADDAPAETVYEVRLKSGIEEGADVPTFTFRLMTAAADGTLRPQLDSVRGQIVDSNNKTRPLVMEDVTFRFMTLGDDRYYLDSGKVSIRGASS